MKQSISIVIAMLCGLIAQVSAQTDTISFSPPEKLGDQINSSAEESLPILSADGKTIYYARTLHSSNIGGKNSGQDIWFNTKDGENFGEARNLKDLNNKRSNVVIGLSKDGNRMYVLNQFVSDKKTIPGISVSSFDITNKVWSAPTPVMVPELNITSTFYSAYVSPYEDFILWSIPAEVDSLGNDLFVSLSTDNGATWTTPMNMGNINTDADEISPFFDVKNDLLFYSANPSGDEENYDIFYAKKLDDTWTSWSEAVNAGEEINSPDFDAYFYTAEDGTSFFSSNRNDSLSNIYKSLLTISKIEEDSIPEEEEPVLIIETIAGTQTGRNLSDLSKEELTAETTKIRFVYFDFDHFNISRKYIEVMDDAANILDNYPELFIQIEGHTDAVGTEPYNKQLSINRANSAKEFMLINGVDPDRIKVIGHGETDPYATNFTQEGRAMNRRVELFFKEM